MVVRQIIAIIKRELRAWFDHPTGYLLLVVAMVFNSFFFFRSLAVNPVASLRSSFELLPWLFIFLVPAVTMRLVAEERKGGVWETILAQPISPWTYLAAKLFAGWKFFGIFLLLTLPVALSLAPYGDFDWGMVAAEYIGALLLVLAMTGVGIAASSATKHQVTSFLWAVGCNFLLFIIGYEVVTVSLPAGVRFFAENLSLAAHYANVTRGVLDVRDLIYFLTLTGAACAVAAWFLLRTQLARGGVRRRRVSIGVLLIVILSAGINLIGFFIRGRIDFTKANVYTLSPVTKALLGNVPDVVMMKLYATKELPPQVALLKRDAEDVLADMRAAGRGNIVAESVTVEEGKSDMEEARSLGVTSIQFNVLKQDSFQAQQGMFGLTVSYAGQHEVIGYLDRTDDLEYRMVRFIKKLTAKEKPKVALLEGHGERIENLANFRGALEEFYTVTDTDVSTSTPVIAEDVRAAIVAGPTQDLSEGAVEALREYLNRGGSVLAVLNGVEVETQTLTANPLPTKNGELFAAYGARVTGVLIADVQANETVTMNSGIFSLLLPYPYWVKASLVKTHPIAGELPYVILPWASSVERTAEGSYDVEEVLTTTEGGVAVSPPFLIDPQQQFRFDRDSFGVKTLAVAMRAKQGAIQSSAGGRVVLVGDADFLSDQFTGERSPNLAFGLNAVDWLTQDEGLIAIRTKSRVPKPLAFSSEAARQRVKYFNLVGVPLTVVLFAAGRLWMRRRKTVRDE